jgi:hypothetical protein
MPYLKGGHRNSLCNIGIISWNKNKKLKESSTAKNSNEEIVGDSGQNTEQFKVHCSCSVPIWFKI